MKTMIKRWPFWVSVLVVLVVASTFAGHSLRFPLGLGLLRGLFLVVEQVWSKARL